MPIVIMPNGEMVDSTTGNPVNTPLNRVPQLEGDMARFIANTPKKTGASLTAPELMGATAINSRQDVEREVEIILRNKTGAAVPPFEIEAYTDQILSGKMSLNELQSDMATKTGSALTDMEKVQMLMDMGLREDEAVQAVAMEKQLPAVEPQDFTGQTGAMLTSEEMGALGALPIPRGNVSTAMGMPEDAMVNQMLNQGDTSGMSPQQIEMLRMGIDPFAEGMIAGSDSRGGVPPQKEYMPADMRRTRSVIR